MLSARLHPQGSAGMSSVSEQLLYDLTDEEATGYVNTSPGQVDSNIQESLIVENNKRKSSNPGRQG